MIIYIPLFVEKKGRKMRENDTMNSNNHKIPLLKFIDSSIRVSVIPLSVATIWLTMTNHQDNDIYGKLSFSNLSGLKYMVCIGFISGFYALFAAVSSWIKCLSNKAWLFFISDQILAYLMVTSVGAVMEIMYLAYNGDKAISWSEACDTYGPFCFRIKLAFIFHSFSLFCFIALAFISAFRLFSNFEPPFVPNQGP